MAEPRGPYDILVIGGGINGCGIARDAAGRGFSVLLAEMGDLAGGTSSWSTKLIHGGLRYLEYFKLRLVREALIEREVLWAAAPHVIRPLRFVLPHHAGLRPAWMLRLGLFVYDHLGGRRRLPPTRVLDLRNDPAGAPLKPGFARGFEYSDCRVDDARLVVLTARDAADRGAEIRTRTEVTALAREGGLWRAELLDHGGGRGAEVAARLVVNAAGPWVDRVLARVAGRGPARHVRLVQGSHIVVPRLADDPRCYTLQNADGRVVFVIPFEGDFSLIGTTDRDFEGDPGKAAIAAEETAYLCDAVSGYFARPVRPGDVVWSYSGVRPLYDDGAPLAQEATRDYVLEQEGDAAGGALINVYGGKITTYRRLAETVLARVEGVLGRRGAPWTTHAPLPGGDFPAESFDVEVEALLAARPFLAPATARRLFGSYGTRAGAVLGGAASMADLGAHFGADLTEVEVAYLMAKEWATTAEDVLWRRGKLGLRLTPAETEALAAFMASRAAPAQASWDDN